MLNIEHLTKTLNIEHWGMNITLYTFNIKHQRSIDIKNCPLNNIEQHWTTLNNIEQHWTSLKNIRQCWTTLNNIEQHRKTNNHIAQHWTSNTEQHWTLNTKIQRWTLNIGNWTMNIEHWTLNIEQWTLNIEQWTMNNELNHKNLPIYCCYSLSVASADIFIVYLYPKIFITKIHSQETVTFQYHLDCQHLSDPSPLWYPFLQGQQWAIQWSTYSGIDNDSECIKGRVQHCFDEAQILLKDEINACHKRFRKLHPRS